VIVAKSVARFYYFTLIAQDALHGGFDSLVAQFRTSRFRSGHMIRRRSREPREKTSAALLSREPCEPDRRDYEHEHDASPFAGFAAQAEVINFKVANARSGRENLWGSQSDRPNRALGPQLEYLGAGRCF
jgi:hypothetical protein